MLVGQPWLLKLPDAIHPIDLEVTYELQLGNSSTFVQFDEANKVLLIDEGTTNEDMIGDYTIMLRLKDSQGV